MCALGGPQKHFFSSWPNTIEGIMCPHKESLNTKFQIFISIFDRLPPLFLFSIGRVLKLTWNPMGDMQTILWKIVENRNIEERAPICSEAGQTYRVTREKYKYDFLTNGVVVGWVENIQILTFLIFFDPPYDHPVGPKIVFLFLSCTSVCLPCLIRKSFIFDHFCIFGIFLNIRVHVSHMVPC